MTLSWLRPLASTECCGAKVYSITHQGYFCAQCDAKVFVTGHVRTPERELELNDDLAQEMAAWMASEACTRCERSWAKVLDVVEGTAECSMVTSMWCFARGLGAGKQS